MTKRIRNIRLSRPVVRTDLPTQPLALSTCRCTPALTESSVPITLTWFLARVIAVYNNSRVSSDDASAGNITDTVSYWLPWLR